MVHLMRACFHLVRACAVLPPLVIGLVLAGGGTALAAERSASLTGNKLVLDEACVRTLKIEPDATLSDRVEIVAYAERASDLDTLKFDEGSVAFIGRDGLCPYDNRIDSTLKLTIKVPPGFATALTLNGRVEAHYGAVGGSLTATMNGRIVLNVDTVKNIDLTVNGAFNGTIDRIDGSATLNGGGFTNLLIRDGAIDRLTINVAGAGKTEILATVGDANLLTAGAGNIRLRAVTGKLDRMSAGIGTIKIGF